MHSNKVIALLLSVTLFGCGGDPTVFAPEAKEPAQSIKPDNIIANSSKALNVPYEIIWESMTKRYDHAPTLLVITDSNSHQRMYDLVNQFAKQKSSKKFTLIVLDDKKAGLAYKASHYGANEVNRIATDAERKFMDKHMVGTYIGELEANGEPYEIMYHGFGFEKESHETYEPEF